MPAGVVISEKKKRQAIDLIKQNISLVNVAEELGIGYSTLGKIKRDYAEEYDLELRQYTKLSEADKEEIFAMYAQGETIRAVADEFNIGENRAGKLRKEYMSIREAELKKKKEEDELRREFNDIIRPFAEQVRFSGNKESYDLHDREFKCVLSDETREMYDKKDDNKEELFEKFKEFKVALIGYVDYCNELKRRALEDVEVAIQRLNESEEEQLRIIKDKAAHSRCSLHSYKNSIDKQEN